MPGPTVSVLMAVYDGTPAQQLNAALGSVVGQTRPADEILVVVDGPVSSEHEAVLAKYGAAIKRVDLSLNVGLGRALEVGLAACSGDWIARADADDLNHPDRLAHQLAVVQRTGADVCSASMREVAGPSMRAVGVRRSPTTHDEFARRMPMTNPVNHPAVMFRRHAAVSAGGYRHLPLLEDYDLWARMLRDGARFVGVDEALVTYRADGMLDRRADRTLAGSERELRRNLRDYGLIGRPGALRNALVRGTYRRLPTGLRARAYALMLRGGDTTGTREALRGAGTLALAAFVAAGLGWLTLVVVARALGPGEYADFSVVWSVYFGVAGILIGLQQETTRSLVAARREPARIGLVGAGAWTTLTVVLAALLVAAIGLALGVTVKDVGNTAGPALLAIPVLAAAMMVNGALAADGRWNALAWLALGDQVVRFGAVILVVQLAPGDVAFGAALVAGLVCFVPFIAIGWSRLPKIAGTRPGFVGRSAAAMVSSGCANVLVVGLPALITATGDGSDRARGVLFAAILLTRTPVLLLANSVRPVVVRVFVANRSQLRAWAWRVAPSVVVATAVAAGVGWALGPWVLRLLFGSDFRVSGPVMAGLVLAAVLILLQTWTGVALAAIDRDLASTVGWLVAVVIAVGCLLLPLALEERTLSALLAGPGAGIAIHLAVLRRSPGDVRRVDQREA